MMIKVFKRFNEVENKEKINDTNYLLMKNLIKSKKFKFHK